MEYCGPIAVSVISPCASDPHRVRARAELPVNVAELLPYVNAVMCGLYNPAVPCFTFTKEERLVTVYPDHVMIDRAHSSTDARELLDWLRSLLNDVYARRAQIVPAHGPIQRPAALQLYRLLPKTNCGRCGYNTCLAFAAALSSGAEHPAVCDQLRPQSLGELIALLRRE